MDWFYESCGVWVANAKLNADGVPLFWRVTVGKHGLFSAAGSDSELMPSSKLFPTFAEAKADCEKKEQSRSERHSAPKCEWCGVFIGPQTARHFVPPSDVTAIEPEEPVLLCRKCHTKANSAK